MVSGRGPQLLTVTEPPNVTVWTLRTLPLRSAGMASAVSLMKSVVGIEVKGLPVLVS